MSGKESLIVACMPAYNEERTIVRVVLQAQKYVDGVVDSDYDLEKLIERVEAILPLERVSVEYVSKDKIQLIL